MTPIETLHCDQAIFTSVRGPMGEGYRIIAASRGLRSEEKQAITRLSPSHEALCWNPASGMDGALSAAAFYPLPTGRLCVAHSCYAGAEHTARGGHRVYTHNVVFDDQEFPRCGFNPFHVVRAMAVEGLTIPNLTPDSVLQEVRLPINTEVAPRMVSFAKVLDSQRRRYVLQLLFDERAIIVPVQEGWLETTEFLLMGLPGPMRVKVSFGAGLRFSLGRCHRLHLFCDEKGVTRSRIAGQPVDYLDPTVIPSDNPASAWTVFVDRHWGRAEYAVLARRTSRPFNDLTPAARERIGKLYIAIDAVPLTDSQDLLGLAADYISDRWVDAEDDIRRELLSKTQRTLLGRLTNTRWLDLQPFWPRLVAFWRQTDAAFAQPLIEVALRSFMKEDSLTSAETAIDVASNLPAALDRDRHERLIDEILTRVAAQLPPDANPERLMGLCNRWQSIRPGHAALRKLMDRYVPATAVIATPR